MNNQKINIDACPYKWKDIQDSNQKNFCTQCEKHIPDLSKYSVEEVQIRIESVECGNFHYRHLEEGAKEYHFINSLERVLRSYGLSKVASITVILYIFVVSCGTKKHIRGRFASVNEGSNKIQKEQVSEPNQYETVRNLTQE